MIKACCVYVCARASANVHRCVLAYVPSRSPFQNWFAGYMNNTGAVVLFRRARARQLSTVRNCLLDRL